MLSPIEPQSKTPAIPAEVGNAPELHEQAWVSSTPEVKNDQESLQKALAAVEPMVLTLLTLSSEEIRAKIAEDGDFGNSVGILADLCEKYAPNSPVAQTSETREIYRLAGLAIEKITGSLNTVSGIEESHALAERNQQEEYSLRKQDMADMEPKILLWQNYGYIA